MSAKRLLNFHTSNYLILNLFLSDSGVQQQAFDTTTSANILSLNVTKQNVGRYKCTATNSLDKLEKTITLTYYGK